MTQHYSISCARYWDALLELDQYRKDEIIFWKKNIVLVKSRFCFSTKKPHVFGLFDASATGYGEVISLGAQHVRHKLWDSSKAGFTRRELAALSFAIASFSSVELSRKMVHRWSSSGKNCCYWQYEARS